MLLSSQEGENGHAIRCYTYRNILTTIHEQAFFIHVDPANFSKASMPNPLAASATPALRQTCISK